MIKKIREYTSEEKFDETFNSVIEPKVTTIVEHVWESNNFDNKMRWFKNQIIIFSLLFVLFVILTILSISLVSYFYGSKKIPEHLNIVALFVTPTIICVVSFLTFLGLVRARKSQRKNFIAWTLEDLNKNLNMSNFYRESFELLNADIEFTTKQTRKELENKHFPKINDLELCLFRGMVSSKHILGLKNNPEHLILHSKYHATLSSGMWIDSTKKNNLKKNMINTTVIKIDTNDLPDSFAFYMSKNIKINFNQFRHGYKKMELENSDFNKEFNFSSAEELRTFSMLTPLSMEMMLERLLDKKNTIIDKISFLSTKESLYVAFNTFEPFQFVRNMEYLHLNKEKMIKNILANIRLAVYTSYYAISLIQIPLYLD